MTYTEGNKNDFEQLKQLGIAAYGAYSDVFDKDNREKWMKSIADDATYKTLLDTATVFTCRDNDKIAGMAYLLSSGHPTDIYRADWCYIRFLGTHPSYTGSGIAKKLTNMCIDRARSTNEKTIALHTSEFMDAARHIYESLGFTRLKEIPLRYGKRYWLYTMQLTN